MKILTQTEARAVKGALGSLGAIGMPFFAITLGEGGAAATIKFNEDMFTVENANSFEIYTSIQSFAKHYEV